MDKPQNVPLHGNGLTIATEGDTHQIISRNRLMIEFDDDKKEIRIVTPCRNIITLSDDKKSIIIEDQNNNMVTLSPTGISMASQANIEIKAWQKLTLTGEDGVFVNSPGGNITITGNNVSACADIQATIQGNAAASLTASGQVTVKGAMVMIN